MQNRGVCALSPGNVPVFVVAYRAPPSRLVRRNETSEPLSNVVKTPNVWCLRCFLADFETCRQKVEVCVRWQRNTICYAPALMALPTHLRSSIVCYSALCTLQLLSLFSPLLFQFHRLRLI